MAALVETKAAVTVTSMARMVGLSRSRFYMLVQEGVFPLPVYEVGTRRPLYTEEQQRLCLAARRRNCGINNKPVMFYARTGGAVAGKRKVKMPSKSAPKDARIAALLDYLNSVNMTTATAAQVQQTIEKLYPSGTEGIDQGEVLGCVYRHLRDGGVQ